MEGNQEIAEIGPISPVFADDKLFQIYQKFYRRIAN